MSNCRKPKNSSRLFVNLSILILSMLALTCCALNHSVPLPSIESRIPANSAGQLGYGNIIQPTRIDNALNKAYFEFAVPLCPGETLDPKNIRQRFSLHDIPHTHESRFSYSPFILENVGVVTFIYNPQENRESNSSQCEESEKQVQSQIFTIENLKSLRKKFADTMNGVAPTGLLFRSLSDGEPPSLAHKPTPVELKNNYISKANDDNSECKMNFRKVQMPEGFATEVTDKMSLSITDNAFRLGNFTHVAYNPKTKNWRVNFNRKNDSKSSADYGEFSGQSSSPFPIATRYRTKSGQPEFLYKLTGTFQLLQNGQAIIQTHKTQKSLLTREELDQAFPYEDSIDSKQGKIVLNANAYNGENNQVLSQMSVNFINSNNEVVGAAQAYGRRVIGSQWEQKWCPEDNCLMELPRGNSLSCTRNGTLGPNINLNKTKGPQQLCYSCLGVTPGLCDPSRSLHNAYRNQFNDHGALDKYLEELQNKVKNSPKSCNDFLPLPAAPSQQHQSPPVESTPSEA